MYGQTSLKRLMSDMHSDFKQIKFYELSSN